MGYRWSATLMTCINQDGTCHCQHFPMYMWTDSFRILFSIQLTEKKHQAVPFEDTPMYHAEAKPSDVSVEVQGELATVVA